MSRMFAAGLGLDVQRVADALVDDDYLLPVNPTETEMVAVPARLWAAVRADAVCDRNRARSEFALLAPTASPAAAVGDAREKQWRAMHPGFAELVDSPP